MQDMHSTDADKTVAHDTGWVADGHHIAWNGQHGAFMGHPDHCLFILENKVRTYLCSPGCYVQSRGISLDDLPASEAELCREFSTGSEPIKWRLQEFLHPDLNIAQEDALSIFEIALDVDDEFEGV